MSEIVQQTTVCELVPVSSSRESVSKPKILMLLSPQHQFHDGQPIDVLLVPAKRTESIWWAVDDVHYVDGQSENFSLHEWSTALALLYFGSVQNLDSSEVINIF